MDEEKKNSVLIVDDENSSIMALMNILKADYIIYASKSGDSAIKAAEKYLPDVILLDILMPNMDGYATISALKNSEKTRHIPVIFITGLSNVDDEEKGWVLGASDYIIKPFSPAIVRLRVQNQIQIINQTRQIIEQKLAEESSRVKVEFLSRVSHEMLIPMNTIVDMTKVAIMSGDSSEIKESLYEIDAASRYLLGLLDDLLEISEKGGAFNLSHAAFSFETMLQNVLKVIGRNVEEKQQTLTFDISPSIPELLIGDEKRLAQVITNLLTNSLKFTQNNGEIRLSAFVFSEDKGTITLQIEVIDNGIGISKERQRNIFNVFNPADESASGTQGMGLGLTISKRIVEKMGGRIWVDSEPGKGSKFTFTCNLRKG